MAETVSTLTIQLEALRRARASGTREIEFRSGSGSMVLQTGRLPGDLALVGRTMSFDFDNTDGRTDINIVVEGQPLFGGVGEREPIEYTFFRDADGAGEFGFVLFGNINEPGQNLPNIERFDMVAKWNSDEAGRGKARVSEGDLGADVFSVDQCWDADDAQVYLEVDFTGDLDLPNIVGDAGQCVVDEGLVDVLLPQL